MDKAILIDADLLVYRAGFAADKDSSPVDMATRTAKGLVNKILADIATEYDEWEVVLSGPSSENFRHGIASYATYKGNRNSSGKPMHYDAIRDMYMEDYDAAMSVGMEADDLLNIKAHGWEALGYHPVIVSVDKDFIQCGHHLYDFVKRTHYRPTAEDMYKELYVQCLMGDDADNIKGILGVGNGKARGYLADCYTAAECYARCLDVYMEWEVLTDEEAVFRVNENCQLLYLLADYEDSWECPVEEV